MKYVVKHSLSLPAGFFILFFLIFEFRLHSIPMSNINQIVISSNIFKFILISGSP